MQVTLHHLCSGGNVSKDVQDLQMPSGESPSHKEIGGDERVGERRGLYQISSPAYGMTELKTNFPPNGTSSSV